jgi:hypothetical protein
MKDNPRNGFVWKVVRMRMRQIGVLNAGYIAYVPLHRHLRQFNLSG